jgi:hypothetical protein
LGQCGAIAAGRYRASYRGTRGGDVCLLCARGQSRLGMFAGVGMNSAQACDNDRFPCPVVSEAVTQETGAAPAEPVQVAQPPKKASQSARPATKPQPRADQSMPRAKNREAAPVAHTTSKTAPPKQRTAPSPKNDLPSETAISASTIVQPSFGLTTKDANQAVVAAAGTAWPTLPTIDNPPVPPAPWRRKRNRQPITPAPSKSTAGPSFPVTGQCLAISL